MSLTIQTQIEENYLLVNFQGFFSKDALLEAGEKSLKVAIQKNLKQILFDARKLEGNPPTTLERFEIGEAFADMQRGMKVVIKCVFVGKEPIADPEQFAETVIVNRGGTVKVFTDITNAAKWLKE